MAQHTPSNRRGATPVTQEHKKRPWWLVVLILVVLLAAIYFILRACDADTAKDDADSAKDAASSATASATPSATTSPSVSPSPTVSASETASATPAVPASGTGTVTVGGQPLLPLTDGPAPDGNFTALTGQDVQATSVQVLSAPTDEGIWVGSDDENRVWVQLLGSDPESGYEPAAGDTVTFTGTMKATKPKYLSRIPLTEADGLTQLTNQGAYVGVKQGDLQPN